MERDRNVVCTCELSCALRGIVAADKQDPRIARRVIYGEDGLEDVPLNDGGVKG